MYRPTVRYHDAFKKYVDAVFQATHLDRNTIFKLALFTAAHSKEFNAILKKHQFTDVPLPQADWGLDDDECWKGKHYTPKQLEKPTVQTEVIQIPSNSGGIKVTLN